jgi:outer membrane receptor protein involved in Fe transport
MTALQANTSGELFTLAADRPVSLALGYEYRLVYGASIPDPITVAGETTGNKSLITSGGYHVNEGYAELSVPVINNVLGAEALELTGAARVFNYSTFGTDWTYKGGLRWRVVRDLTFRGTYSTAFRAPGVGDLYGGQGDSFPPVSDPCRGPLDPRSPLFAACGPAANSGDDQTQLRTRRGGNPDLKPETAKIFTVGAVIEPSIVKNFSVTVDYYNFSLEQTISRLGADVILSSCYPAQAGVAPKYCDKVLRNPASQRIDQIIDLDINVGQTKTDGIDIALRYALPTEVGRFGFIVDATWLNRYNKTLADGSLIKAKGTYDIGVYPAWKANAGANWSMAGASAGLVVRFIGAYKECADNTGIMNGGGLCYQDDTYQRRVAPSHTEDVYLGYTIASTFGKTNIAVGANNLFDRKPSVIYNGFLASSDPTGGYDFMGRFVYGRVTQTF